MGLRSRSAPAVRLRQESGFGLIEVLVSCMLLAVLVIGLLGEIDGSAALSGANKARSAAAALAQQDQERLRGLRSADLPGYNSTREVTLGRVTYTVTSNATWLSDASGDESCTSNSNLARYFQIASTVTWPAIGAGKPVKAVSLVAPSASLSASAGNLAVMLTDAAGNPIAGVPVTVAPGGGTISTNDAGCAFFPLLAVGTYQASFSGGSLVNTSGVSNITLSGSVVGGATTTLSDSLGQAAQASVTFDTRVGTATPVAAQSKSATIVNPGLPAPGPRTSTFTSPQTAISFTNVFPFPSGYGAYAGNCSAANPTQYNPTYYTQNPSRYLNVTPGGSASVEVRAPALNVTVRRNGNAYANAHVVVTATGSGCTDKVTMSSNSSGALVKGAAPYQVAAMPFGTYSVCADDGNRKVTVTVSNTEANGNQAANSVANVPTSGDYDECT